MHIARRAMARATGGGWSLRHPRERVRRAASRLILSGGRMALALSRKAAPFWALLWLDALGRALNQLPADSLPRPDQARPDSATRSRIRVHYLRQARALPIGVNLHAMRVSMPSTSRPRILDARRPLCRAIKQAPEPRSANIAG